MQILEPTKDRSLILKYSKHFVVVVDWGGGGRELLVTFVYLYCYDTKNTKQSQKYFQPLLSLVQLKCWALKTAHKLTLVKSVNKSVITVANVV